MSLDEMPVDSCAARPNSPRRLLGRSLLWGVALAWTLHLPGSAGAGGSAGGVEPSPAGATVARSQDDPLEPTAEVHADDGVLDELARADGLLRLGRAEAALAALDALVRTAGAHEAVLRTRLWALLAAARPAEALADLALRDELSSELQLVQALGLLAVGDPDACAALGRVWLGAPRSAFGLWSLRSLAGAGACRNKAYAAADARLIEATIPDRRVLPEPFVAEPVVDALGRGAKGKGRLALELDYAEGERLLGADDARGAIDILTQVSQSSRDRMLSRRAQLALGEAHRRLGASQKALAHFDKLARDLSDAIGLEAQARAGQTLIAIGEFRAAQKRFEARLVETPVGPARRDALFGLGWIGLRTGDFASARRFFSTLIGEAPHARLAPAALFFSARAAREQGDEVAARAALCRLVGTFPLDYYTYRASADAADCGEPPPPLDAGTDVRHLGDLLDRGLSRRAAATLARLLPQVGDLGPKDLEVMLRAAESLSDATAARRILWYRQHRFPTDADRQELRSDYPPRLRRILDVAAKKQRLDPALVAALVRQESRFDPRAESRAGAMGLMQLMVPTALGLVRENRRNASLDATALTDPGLNAELGTKYLARMVRAFGGGREYALAAYNAGPGAVTRWREERGELPPELFVEEIPYAETREYVKRVLANVQTLRWLEARAEAERQRWLADGTLD